MSLLFISSCSLGKKYNYGVHVDWFAGHCCEHQAAPCMNGGGGGAPGNRILGYTPVYGPGHGYPTLSMLVVVMKIPL